MGRTCPGVTAVVLTVITTILATVYMAASSAYQLKVGDGFTTVSGFSIAYTGDVSFENGPEEFTEGDLSRTFLDLLRVTGAARILGWMSLVYLLFLMIRGSHTVDRVRLSFASVFLTFLSLIFLPAGIRRGTVCDMYPLTSSAATDSGPADITFVGEAYSPCHGYAGSMHGNVLTNVLPQLEEPSPFFPPEGTVGYDWGPPPAMIGLGVALIGLSASCERVLSLSRWLLGTRHSRRGTRACQKR